MTNICLQNLPTLFVATELSGALSDMAMKPGSAMLGMKVKVQDAVTLWRKPVIPKVHTLGDHRRDLDSKMSKMSYIILHHPTSSKSMDYVANFLRPPTFILSILDHPYPSLSSLILPLSIMTS